MREMDGFAVAEKIRNDSRLTGAAIMMLTSAGYIGDAARCRDLGISAYLIKPILPGELLDAVCRIIPVAGAKKDPVLPSQNASPKDWQRTFSILLAEDNTVNQALAVRLLEKRGHHVTVTSDGLAALAALEKSTFDVVLMDVQMPVMDGFAAAAAIRTKESVTGGHIPIIAMTAHALKGDVERCLAAGMDAYIAKPIHAADLYGMLEKVVSSRERPTAEPLGAERDPVPR